MALQLWLQGTAKSVGRTVIWLGVWGWFWSGGDGGRRAVAGADKRHIPWFSRPLDNKPVPKSTTCFFLQPFVFFTPFYSFQTAIMWSYWRRPTCLKIFSKSVFLRCNIFSD